MVPDPLDVAWTKANCDHTNVIHKTPLLPEWKIRLISAFYIKI